MAKTKPAADQAAAGVNNVADSATKASAALDKTSASMDTAAAKTSSLAQGLEGDPDRRREGGYRQPEQLAASPGQGWYRGGRQVRSPRPSTRLSQKLVSVTRKPAPLSRLRLPLTGRHRTRPAQTLLLSSARWSGRRCNPADQQPGGCGPAAEDAGFTSLASARALPAPGSALSASLSARRSSTWRGCGVGRTGLVSASKSLSRYQTGVTNTSTGLQKLDVSWGRRSWRWRLRLSPSSSFETLRRHRQDSRCFRDGTVERLYAAGAGTDPPRRHFRGSFKLSGSVVRAALDAVAAVNSFAEQVQKTGAFTGDMLRQLQKESAGGARSGHRQRVHRRGAKRGRVCQDARQGAGISSGRS